MEGGAMRREKISQAVSACLEACYGSDDPLARLALFVEALKKDELWTEAEVWAVETQSLKLLNLIVTRPSVSTARVVEACVQPPKIDTP
jgi:hypothetical protein